MLLMVVSWVAFKSSVVCRGSSCVVVFNCFSLGSPYVDIFCILFAPLSREFWAIFNYRKKKIDTLYLTWIQLKRCISILTAQENLKPLKCIQLVWVSFGKIGILSLIQLVLGGLGALVFWDLKFTILDLIRSVSDTMCQLTR